MPVGRNGDDAQWPGAARRAHAVTSPVPPISTAPASAGAHAHQRLGQFGLAVAADAGDAIDLAARAGRAARRSTVTCPSARAAATALEREHRRADRLATALGAPAAARRRSARSGPAAISSAAVTVATAAAAHDRDPVGEAAHLVQLVGHQHDGGAARRQARARSRAGGPPRGRSAPRSARRGSGPRLPASSTFRISTRCCSAIDSCRRALRGRCRKPSAAAWCRDRVARLRAAPLRKPPARIGEQHVLDGGERLHQLEVLVHHADAEAHAHRAGRASRPLGRRRRCGPASGA